MFIKFHGQCRALQLDLNKITFCKKKIKDDKPEYFSATNHQIKWKYYQLGLHFFTVNIFSLSKL